MSPPRRPHLLGIDDGPFRKGRDRETPLVAVAMEGSDLVEAVAVSRFPIDGADLTGTLARWIRGLRIHPSLQGLLFGGLTAAGLAVVEPRALAEATGIPVLVVNRRPPTNPALIRALRAAGLEQRVAMVQKAPLPFRVSDGLFASAAGTDEASARALLRASCGKSALPEPLRLAHLIATALVRGSSYGRP